jgi:hypothetical protein
MVLFKHSLLLFHRKCRLAPTWAELATKATTENLGFKVGNVDCTINKDVCAAFGVRGYPTVKL